MQYCASMHFVTACSNLSLSTSAITITKTWSIVTQKWFHPILFNIVLEKSILHQKERKTSQSYAKKTFSFECQKKTYNKMSSAQKF